MPIFFCAYIKSMPKITYIDNSGNSKTVNVSSGLSVMEGAIQNNIPGIDADCGGSMACATCHVYVQERWLGKLNKAEDGEQDMLDMALETKKNSRLSCQILISEENKLQGGDYLGIRGVYWGIGGDFLRFPMKL